MLPHCRFQTGHRELRGSDSSREFSLSESRIGPCFKYLVENLELLFEPFILSTHIRASQRTSFKSFQNVSHLSLPTSSLTICLSSHGRIHEGQLKTRLTSDY